MKIYRLKEDFAGKHAGYEFETETLTVEWKFKGITISAPITSELFEEVHQQVFMSDEHLVYIDGKSQPINKGQEYYYVNGDNLMNGIEFARAKTIGHMLTAKRFLTRTAAEDYIKLASYDTTPFKREFKDLNSNYLPFENNKLTPYLKNSTFNGSRSFNKFRIYNGEVYGSIDGCYSEDYAWIKLNTIKFTKVLMFGNKEAKLEYDKGIDQVFVMYEHTKSSYTKVKNLYDAILTIQNFSIGDLYKIDYLAEDIKDLSLATQVKNIKKIKIGCTVGTLDEIKAIVEACEELLKNK